MNLYSFPTKISNGVNAAIKAFRMQFSGSNPAGGGYATGGILPIDDAVTLAQVVRRFMTDINYAREIGDITNSSLVMAAVSWVGRTLPEAMIRVVEPNQKGKDEPVANHPFVTRLRRPNPHYSGATLWKASALSWILSGNIYWLKKRNVRGGVAEIYWWPHWMIRPIRASRNDFISYYEVEVDGMWIQLSEKDSRDIVHFRDGIDPHNDMVGMSPLAALLREIYADNRTADYRASVMKNGGAIPYALVPKDPLLDVDEEQIKDEIMRKTTGENVGKPLVLSAALELLRLAITPRDMLIDEFAKVPEERMAAVIGIPGMVLGFGAALARSTFSNYEQAAEAAYETYMVPLWRYLDEEITLQILLRDYEGAESLRRVDHDLSTVRALQEDEDAKHKRIQSDYQQGIITRAEARAEIGFEVDDARDNVFLVRAGTSTVPADAETVQMEHEARRVGLEMQVEMQRAAADAARNPQPAEASDEENGDAPPREQPRALAAAGGRKLLPEQKDIGWHQYSSVQINLTQDLADKMVAFGSSISDLDLDFKGREGEPHVTVKYGLHTQIADDVQMVLSHYDAGARPFDIIFGKTDYFEAEEYDVVFVRAESAMLTRLNSLLSMNLDHTTTHTGYTPHATVAFVKSGRGAAYAGMDFLDGLTMQVDHLIFGSANGERSMIRLDKGGPTILRYLKSVERKAVNPEFVASETDTVEWLLSVLPPDAQGLATPEVMG